MNNSVDEDWTACVVDVVDVVMKKKRKNNVDEKETKVVLGREAITKGERHRRHWFPPSSQFDLLPLWLRSPVIVLLLLWLRDEGPHSLLTKVRVELCETTSPKPRYGLLSHRSPQPPDYIMVVNSSGLHKFGQQIYFMLWDCSEIQICTPFYNWIEILQRAYVISTSALWMISIQASLKGCVCLWCLVLKETQRSENSAHQALGKIRNDAVLSFSRKSRMCDIDFAPLWYPNICGERSFEAAGP